jgi:hypothetical protein
MDDKKTEQSLPQKRHEQTTEQNPGSREPPPPPKPRTINKYDRER